MCLAVLIGAAVFTLGLSMVRWINHTIEEYTETSPMPLPKVEISPEELAALNARVNAFGREMDAHTNAATLVLNGREVNALLQNSDVVTNLHLNDRFFVSLEGEKLKAQISVPLDQYLRFPLLKTKGRYLNGNGAFTASVTNGELSVLIQSLEVKGKPVPAKFISRMQEQNFAETVNSNPTNTAAMSRFESVVITNGTLVIKSKP